MNDNDTITTLSCEDALTLEWEYDADDEMNVETYFVELSDDEDMDYPDTEEELEQEDETDDFWPTDEQVAAWEDADAAWRNPDAYWTGDAQYDPDREI